MVTRAAGVRRVATAIGNGVVAVIAAAVVLGACGSSPEVPLGPDGEPDPVLLVGRDVFGNRCASCHGSDGGGGRGPKLNDGAVVEAYPDIAEQIDIVTNGKGDGMPLFSDKLTPDEIEAVVRYTREVL
jgi:mono/diheme cytochrome c family protein